MSCSGQVPCRGGRRHASRPVHRRRHPVQQDGRGRRADRPCLPAGPGIRHGRGRLDPGNGEPRSPTTPNSNYWPSTGEPTRPRGLRTRAMAAAEPGRNLRLPAAVHRCRRQRTGSRSLPPSTTSWPGYSPVAADRRRHQGGRDAASIPECAATGSAFLASKSTMGSIVGSESRCLRVHGRCRSTGGSFCRSPRSTVSRD